MMQTLGAKVDRVVEYLGLSLENVDLPHSVVCRTTRKSPLVPIGVKMKT
jgi:hypothetical protein